MAITVKHSKVSTIPDDADTNLVRPSDWNADHTLTGLGTIAEQNANAVAITGGTATLTSLTTPTVQATNSAGLSLKNSGGTTQINVGAGGGNNVTVSAPIAISPANGLVNISPTGTGSVTVNPATAGTINNMSIGASTASTGAFTTLGVGTSSPSTKLNVVAPSTDYFTAQLAVGENSIATGKQLQLGYNTTLDKGYVQSVHWGTGYTDLFLNPNGGNVNVGAGNLSVTNNLGIGTTSPVAKLNISSPVGTAEDLIVFTTGYGNPSGNKSILWKDVSSPIGRISVSYTAPQSAMSFGSLYNSGYQTSDLMTIFGSGGVSIGNSVDKGASSLNVSGLIFPQQSASAPAYVKGAIYFDTTLNKLRVGGVTTWETITSI